MGGRGTFASGNNVAYTYKTVDKIAGVKVLQPIDSKKVIVFHRRRIPLTVISY